MPKKLTTLSNLPITEQDAEQAGSILFNAHNTLDSLDLLTVTDARLLSEVRSRVLNKLFKRCPTYRDSLCGR